MKRLLLPALAGVFFVAMALQASAHVISIGYENSGPGSVTFWYGSYHSHGMGDGPDLEGSFQLVGINGNSFPATIVPFTLDTGTKPGGLVDGVTNFYANNSGGVQATNVTGLPVTSWQGVTFVGLSPGDYQFMYIPIGNPSAHWAPWNEAIRTGQLTITADVINAPEPATMLAWSLIAGVGAMGYRLRKRKNLAAA